LGENKKETESITSLKSKEKVWHTDTPSFPLEK